ncbi:MAG TPA: DUF2971 domain-containing protein [Thermoanaerobaculia bacterium]|nr:DUF2971 domain-containing protein [Thermoanaerobaculia bacterium]
MEDIPGHSLPDYTEASRNDALFHYTTASGLIGIFRDRELWTTTYHCANDETELAAGKGVLEPLFREKTLELIRSNDARVVTFHHRGVDPMEYGNKFEGTLVGLALNSLSAFMSCFCKPNGQEDFHHGLLSQWRGYGTDGGYALHFSREKLVAAIKRAKRADGLNYELQDVYYAAENTLKAEVLKHADAFVSAYLRFLDHFAEPLEFRMRTVPNLLADLVNGPLEALLDYLIHTKSSHFGEERECRLSLVQLIRAGVASLPVSFFNRGGLLVPYTKTPASFDVLECIEWIVIGPGPRMEARFKSVGHLIRQSGQSIKLRVSHIPFTRF